MLRRSGGAGDAQVDERLCVLGHGQTLLSHAIPLLASASRAWEEVARAGLGEAGQVSVSYAPTARREVLPRILAEVHLRYPRLDVKSCEIWWGRDAITSGLADVSIIRGPVPDDPDITGATLMQSPIGIVLGSSHRLAEQETLHVDELADAAFEIPARRFSPAFHDAILEVMRSRGFEGEVIEYDNLGSRFLLDDSSACENICSGRAFGFGFENQYPSLPPELVWIPIEPVLCVPMTMCWRQNSSTSTQSFVEVALDVAREEGWVGDAIQLA